MQVDTDLLRTKIGQWITSRKNNLATNKTALLLSSPDGSYANASPHIQSCHDSLTSSENELTQLQVYYEGVLSEIETLAGLVP